MKTISDLRTTLENVKPRSAWDKGVKSYAFDLLDRYEEYCEYEREDRLLPLMEKTLLNGASDWYSYSWGGCSFISDCDIANRLCTPSELSRTNSGKKAPNSRESWLDVQARALTQACALLLELSR
jgi:hypothetical protein